MSLVHIHALQDEIQELRQQLALLKHNSRPKNSQYQYCHECPYFEISDGESDQSVWCNKSMTMFGYVGMGQKWEVPDTCPLL